MFKYELSIPVKITYGDELSERNLCSLINTKMHEETDELIRYTTVGHNVNYPDLLAHYIRNTTLKNVVKSITFDKAIVNDQNEYAIVFKIITNTVLDQPLTNQLIDYMAGQMSDGLLEDGLVLLENVKNPNVNEEDHGYYYEQFFDLCLWPEWIGTDRYILEEEN